MEEDGCRERTGLVVTPPGGQVALPRLWSNEARAVTSQPILEVFSGCECESSVPFSAGPSCPWVKLGGSPTLNLRKTWSLAEVSQSSPDGRLEALAIGARPQQHPLLAKFLDRNPPGGEAFRPDCCQHQDCKHGLPLTAETVQRV